MRNSTDQLLKTKSNHIKEVTPRSPFYSKEIENNDFINHDYPNHYRTSYNDMSNKVNFITFSYKNILIKEPRYFLQTLYSKISGICPCYG